MRVSWQFCLMSVMQKNGLSIAMFCSTSPVLVLTQYSNAYQTINSQSTLDFKGIQKKPHRGLISKRLPENDKWGLLVSTGCIWFVHHRMRRTEVGILSERGVQTRPQSPRQSSNLFIFTKNLWVWRIHDCKLYWPVSTTDWFKRMFNLLNSTNSTNGYRKTTRFLF